MIQQIIDFLASIGSELETFIHPDVIILPHFPRSIQLDCYSCGAKSLYTILRYYGKRCSPASVKKELEADEDGTSVSDIKRVIKQHHLEYRTLRRPKLKDLKAAINDGSPILVSLYDGSHYAVVYGYSDSHMFVSNPSLNILTGYGSIRCAITNSEFREAWDRWGIVVDK